MPSLTSKPSSKKAPTESKVGGKKLGRCARRAAQKNNGFTEEFVEQVEAATTREEIQAMVAEGIVLARVQRGLGCGTLSVIFQQSIGGKSEGVVAIAGTIKLKGRASTKTASGHCMCAGDHILVVGGQASAKLTKVQVSDVKAAFARLDLRVPTGFFAEVVAMGAAAIVLPDTDEDEFDWDRSEDAVAEKEAAEARKLAAKVQQGNRRVAGKVGVAAAASASALEDDAAATAEARKLVAASAIPTVAPVAPVAAAAVVDPAAPKLAGPTRAERRAAAAAAAAAEAELAAIRSLQAAILPEDVPVAKPKAKWVDTDEVDIDAI